MKKILLLMLLFGATTAFAQKARFGLKGGVNFANQEFEANGISAKLSSLTSFHLHGLADIGLSNSFSIQPGLGISGKGYKLSEGGQSATVNMMYLDIPVNAVAKLPLPGFGNFIVGAGPYAGIGIAGKAKMGSESDDTFGEDGYKRPDFGVNFLAGFETKSGFIINGNYGLGLANTFPENEEDVTAKNRVFSLSIGFLF